ncbi:hypothetical protein ECG_00356 [Echinococcus granulosus]|uniref:Transducin/WD40 repeat-like superfamily protein n=1 Tax=Echinococcus granulosus TaxID=6210 RepID=A0A068WVH7_ECHGR|nr:hypothetical protein ECG_00356 [Echinococcus granulosus]CDS22491.1 hypothetical protein EgrG_002031700 [Echinococcus granulosus]
MEEEVLRDGNEYVCSVCQQSQSAIRLTRIHRAPPILSLGHMTGRPDDGLASIVCGNIISSIPTPMWFIRASRRSQVNHCNTDSWKKGT